MTEAALAVAPAAASEDKIKRLPKVGDTLHFKHEVKRNSAGDFVGYRRVDTKDRATITGVYLGGMVRVGHSEVWACEYAGENATGSVWNTVAASTNY